MQRTTSTPLVHYIIPLVHNTQYQFNERVLSMLMSPSNRFEMPPPSTKMPPTQHHHHPTTSASSLHDHHNDLDGYSDVVNMVNADGNQGVDQADCTTADHHAVPVDQAHDDQEEEQEERHAQHHTTAHRPSGEGHHTTPFTTAAPPPGVLVRPQPRRSHDVDASSPTGLVGTRMSGIPSSGNRGVVSLDAGTRHEASSGVPGTPSTVRRRQVSWIDPVPLWSVDHFVGVTQGGLSRGGTLQPPGDGIGERGSQRGRGSLEYEYYTTREWEAPVQEDETALHRSSV